jgi:hypothetical protein
MGKNDSPLDIESLHELAEHIRVLNGKLRRRLREEAHVGDFTPSQIQVLGLLEREGPATVTELARLQGMRPQSMGETLSVLKAAARPTPTTGVKRFCLSHPPFARRSRQAAPRARTGCSAPFKRAFLPRSSGSSPPVSICSNV